MVHQWSHIDTTAIAYVLQDVLLQVLAVHKAWTVGDAKLAFELSIYRWTVGGALMFATCNATYKQCKTCLVNTPEIALRFASSHSR